MQNKLTSLIARGWVVSVIGVVMLPFGSAAAAGLSPQDQCAIAKLEATSREAQCLADAQIDGIRRDLTDDQVNKQKLACRLKEHARFENAENLPGKCKTINDDAAIDYGLRLTTDIPRSCGEDGPPCKASNPETLSTATLQNKTSHPITEASLVYINVPLFCNKQTDTFKHGGENPQRIEPGQIGAASAGACLIIAIHASIIANGNRITCDRYLSSGTGYRTFQVVPRGDGCVVNRP